ncbi:MAG: DUF2029 domain-containing protein [Anaerolineales bacterium]|nr:DUF2029 domain-containing protein [Anaerolineales bacterium]
MKNIVSERSNTVIGLLLIFILSWNFWLPLAEDFFNLETSPPNPANVDFLAYYNAGGRFAEGANPYYWEDLEEGEKEYSDYLYPPAMLPIFSLLSNLPYEIARHVWLGLYAISCIVVFAVMYINIQKDIKRSFLLLGVLLTFASYPLLFHIRNGQSDLLVISLILLGFVAYWRGFKFISAFILALATLLKVSPVFLLIFYVIYLRDLRFLLYYALSIGAAVLLSLFFVPAELYPDYVLGVLPEVTGGTSYWLNQSIVKHLTFNPTLARLISLSGFVIFAIFAFVLGNEDRRRPSRQDHGVLGDGHLRIEAVFILNLLVILIFAGKVWSMAYVWMILPCAFLLAYLIYQEVRLWFLMVVGLAVFLMTSKVYGFPILESLNLYGGILMAVALILWLLKSELVLLEESTYG